MAPTRPFDHERLDVYQAALVFVRLARQMIADLPRGRATLADQLDRAASSIVLNIAEGSGEFSAKEKARFYRMALRSATECAAILDILALHEAVPNATVQEGKKTLHRIAAMLTVLAKRHDSLLA